MKLFTRSILPIDHPFQNNKYTQWYYDIINNARNRILDKSIYIERHHIIPKSMNGSNDKINLVKLTAREHFICHWLLTKMVSKNNYKRMLNAVWRMICVEKNGKRYKVNSRTYQKLREDFALLMSDRIVSPETCKKISNSNTGRIQTDEHRYKNSTANKGKKKSSEHVEKVANALRGITLVDRYGSERAKEICIQRSLHLKGKKLKKETKIRKNKGKTYKEIYGEEESINQTLKRSKAQKGKLIPKFVCPHCNKTIGGRSNLSRWHLDNCKQILRSKNF